MRHFESKSVDKSPVRFFLQHPLLHIILWREIQTQHGSYQLYSFLTLFAKTTLSWQLKALAALPPLKMLPIWCNRQQPRFPAAHVFTKFALAVTTFAEFDMILQ